MNAKLAIRNVRRSARDYLIYFLTMTFVTALMSAFNSILFTEDVQKMFEVAGLMAALVGMATFFIVLIVAWLINYMVRFMLEKRSREFGIYLLIGMKKKEIARLYIWENILLGTGAFLIGTTLGILLQQVLMSVLYTMIQMDYHLRIQLNAGCVLMTAGCYAGCYLLALFRCKRRFKKMNIRDLMDAQRKNEEIEEKHENLKRWILPVSIVFLAAFGVLVLMGMLRSPASILAFLVGLILVIYLFYTGLSSWIICYVRKKGNKIYQGQNLFLLRQFSSKLKTMRFTMGTLTSLFTIAFLGCAVAMMFSDYQNKVLDDKFPFDVQVYSNNANDDFGDELKILKEDTQIQDLYTYQIYTNGTNQVNTWLYTHLKVFGNMYKKEDGSVNEEKITRNQDRSYCDYDTYMGMSDYNRLREMLGYPEVRIADDEYLIHIKERVYAEIGDFSKHLTVNTGGQEREALTFAGYHTEPFSQDGHNGGDYVIVVPDAVISQMEPYYAELAVDLKRKAPENLVKRLDALSENQDFAGHPQMEGNNCYGSDTVVSYAAVNLVRDNLIPEVKYMLASLIFPAFYIGAVFVCVALTVLSVHQLSDSAKYRFRYAVLQKLGLGRKEISKVVLKQLVGYYLCPALLAAGISGIIIVFASQKFIFYTGVKTPVFQYYGMTFLLFFGVYVIYFVATYVGFRRNIDEK